MRLRDFMSDLSERLLLREVGSASARWRCGHFTEPVWITDGTHVPTWISSTQELRQSIRCCRSWWRWTMAQVVRCSYFLRCVEDVTGGGDREPLRRHARGVLRVLGTCPVASVGPARGRPARTPWSCAFSPPSLADGRLAGCPAVGVSTAYVTLARLEERGLVERHVDRHGRRTLRPDNRGLRAVLVHHHRRRARCTDPTGGSGAVPLVDGPLADWRILGGMSRFSQPPISLCTRPVSGHRHLAST